MHTHIYYADTSDSIVNYLKNIPFKFDLYITTDTKNKSIIIDRRFETLLNIKSKKIFITPNRGRNVAPMLVTVGKYLISHDIILHIHSKKSLHSSLLEGWLEYLFQKLLGSPKKILAIINQFSLNKNLGILFPEPYHENKKHLGIGRNLSRMKELLKRDGRKNIESVDQSFFPAGFMFWCRGLAIKPLVDMNLAYEDFETENGQVDGCLQHAVERLLPTFSEKVHLTTQQYNFTNLKSDKKKFINKISKIPSIKKNKLINNIAIYLPQFHNDRYNNSFWGENFTEWTNLKKSKKLFGTHYLSTPLNGFYDITNKDIQTLQSDLLDIYNLDAFCIYFYWFDKKRPLEKGILSYRDNNRANKKFFLCWANENWTRKWNGADRDVLLKQNYTEEDFIEMVEYLCKNYFSNTKYYRIDNKVIFMIYRPNLIPDLYKKVVLMREICKKNFNLELYLGYFESFERTNPLKYNLDFSSDFSPNMKAKQLECKDLTSSINFFNPKCDTVLDYNSLIDVSKNYEFDNQYKKFRSVTPAWDNSPRVAGTSRIFINSDPEKFYYYTLNAIKYLKENFIKKKSFLFVNAFNEWGEGAYIEPDRDEGYARIEAFRLATIGAAFIPYETNDINSKCKNSIFEDTDILSATINGNKEYDKNKKTILIVAHYICSNSTGAELSFLDIIKNIDQNKFNIIILLPSLGNEKYVLECINYAILIYVIRSGPLILKSFYDIDILKKIKKIITFHKVNCIYLNTIIHNEILEISKLNDITTIVHCREILSKDQHLQTGLFRDSKMSIYKFYEKFNHKNIHFIVNSIATKNELKKINKKKYLLYNCFKILDKNNYKLFSAIREKSKTFNICIISSNDPRKGLINFFEVAKNFASSRKFQFHIFGETTEYLKNLFCKFEKPENVILRGYVPNPCKTIKDLHLLLSVSEFHESFGRTIVEAFSVGIPVIGNNKGALPELIISNFNGFNCLSIEDICKKIIFLNTLNNYKEFSKNAYKSSLRFDEKLFKIKLNQIVSKLI